MIFSSGTASGLKVILPGEKHGRVVILSAPADTPPGALASVAGYFSAHGMLAVADVAEDGSHLLRVSGFKDASQVTQVLAAQGIAAEVFRREESVSPKAKGFTGWLKHHSLRICGFTYLLGDASFVTAGLLSRNYLQAAGGMLYASGGAVSAAFGNPVMSRQIRNVSARLGDFLASQGVDIPAHSALQGLTARRTAGWLGKAQDFLYRHPSEFHNALYSTGGALYAKSGLDKRAKGKAGWWKDMAAGALVTGGGLIGGFVREKHDTEKTGMWNWIKRQPLRLSGYMYGLNNLLMLGAAWDERKEDLASPGQNYSYIFKFLTALFFLIANTFMSITSRDRISAGKNDGDKCHIIEALAAEVIAAQPEARQRELVSQAAAFLSKQPETKDEMSKIEAALARKVIALRVSPWRAGTALNVAEIAPERERARQPWQERIQLSEPLPGLAV